MSLMLSTGFWRSCLRKLFFSPRKRPSLRLRIEQLEERTLPSTVTWINPNEGAWDVGTNWSTGAVPGSGDDAVISTSSTATITIQASDVIEVQSLTTAEN